MFRTLPSQSTTIDRDNLKLLIKALNRIYRAPEVRTEKTTRLAGAIHRRTYRIDCRKLADRLILGLFFGCF